jgi:flagellar hook-length control protein FliK
LPLPAHVSHLSPQSDTAFAAQVASLPANAPADAQKAAAAQYQPIDPHAVIEQVVKGIAVHNSGASSEVRLRLQPEHLGDVSLKLTVNGNTIDASVVAQNAGVRDVLLSNQHQLAHALSESGLSLGQFSVDVSGGNPGFTQQQTQQQHASNRAMSLGELALGEDETWADPRTGPPLLHGPRALVLNYLA